LFVFSHQSPRVGTLIDKVLDDGNATSSKSCVNLVDLSCDEQGCGFMSISLIDASANTPHKTP
jgi:hypothetical protein